MKRKTDFGENHDPEGSVTQFLDFSENRKPLSALRIDFCAFNRGLHWARTGPLRRCILSNVRRPISSRSIAQDVVVISTE